MNLCNITIILYSRRLCLQQGTVQLKQLSIVDEVAIYSRTFDTPSKGHLSIKDKNSF